MFMKKFITKIINFLFYKKPCVVVPEKEFYKFDGRVFASDSETIKRLNYALALNGSEKRYTKVLRTPNKD